MARRFNIVDGASSSVGMGKLHSTVQSVHGFYKRLSFNLTKLEASSARFGSRSGQAMAEFLVGLVGIMFLVVGLQQIAFLSDRSFEIHHRVRGAVAEQMMEPGADYIEGFSYTMKTDIGADGKPYTGDDQVVVGNDDVYAGSFGVMYAVDDGWLSGYLSDYIPPSRDNDPYTRLENTGGYELSKNFAMFYAEEQASVEVVPFFRRLLGRELINLRQEIWMPALDGLME